MFAFLWVPPPQQFFQEVAVFLSLDQRHHAGPIDALNGCGKWRWFHFATCSDCCLTQSWSSGPAERFIA